MNIKFKKMLYFQKILQKSHYYDNKMSINIKVYLINTGNLLQGCPLSTTLFKH